MTWQTRYPQSHGRGVGFPQVHGTGNSGHEMSNTPHTGSDAWVRHTIIGDETGAMQMMMQAAPMRASAPALSLRAPDLRASTRAPASKPSQLTTRGFYRTNLTTLDGRRLWANGPTAHQEFIFTQDTKTLFGPSGYPDVLASGERIVTQALLDGRKVQRSGTGLYYLDGTPARGAVFYRLWRTGPGSTQTVETVDLLTGKTLSTAPV